LKGVAGRGGRSVEKTVSCGKKKRAREKRERGEREGDKSKEPREKGKEKGRTRREPSTRSPVDR